MAGDTIITVVGNLTADPEVRTTSNGGTVADFTIASTPRQYNRNSGQWEDGDALFLRCSAWDSTFAPLATNVQASLAKGMRVIAQGRLAQRSYQDREGNNRTVVELRVDEVGPALTRGTAQVTRTQGSGSGAGGNGGRGGFAGSQQGGGYQGGYQGGASAPAGGPAQGGQAPAQQAPAQDPWSTPSNGSGGSFGSFGSSDDFGGSGDEPEF